MPKPFLARTLPNAFPKAQLITPIRAQLILVTTSKSYPSSSHLNPIKSTITPTPKPTPTSPRYFSQTHYSRKMSTAPSPVFKKGNTAVITGGASGIGLALARKCAGYGMHVVICDNNVSNLKGAKESIGGDVEVVEVDVGKVEEFEKVKAKVPKTGISLLALNAGIGGKGTWSDSAYFHKIMDVNLFGVIHGLNALLPLVVDHSTASAPASIIITGSKQGITNPPGNAAYNASKAAVKTLTEHLSFDLAKSSPTTSVHLLVPGWTFTGLSGNAPFAKAGEEKKEKPAGAWSPEQVVEYLEGKMAEGKFYVICPDNDVTEEMDKKRMLWDRLDLVEGRPPLTRWREDYKAESEKWMKDTKI